MEEQKENILLEDLKFPKDFKFEKTTNGFKINSTGGEFFPNKLAGPITLSFWLIIIGFAIFGNKYFHEFVNEYLKNIIWYVNHSILYNIMFYCIIFIFFAVIPYCIMLAIKMLTDIDTEYTFSPSGININSKKGKLFISKSNISDIYSKDEEVSTKNGNYTKYCVYLDFRTMFYIPDTNKNVEKVDMFSDSIFTDEKISLFLVQEIKKVFSEE